MQINDLSFYRGKKLILDKINLKVDIGEKIIILGENGSGKTTLFKLISNSIKTNKIINNFKTLFYLPDNYILPKDRFARDFLYEMMINFNGAYPLDKLMEYLEIPDYKIKKLSKGNRQKVAILLGLVSNSELVLYDEILDGLDQSMIRKVLKLIKNSSKTIMMITHYKHYFKQMRFRVLKIENNKLSEY